MLGKNSIVEVIMPIQEKDALMCIGFIKSVEWDSCAEKEIYELEFPDFLNENPCCLPINYNVWYYAEQLHELKLVKM